MSTTSAISRPVAYPQTKINEFREVVRRKLEILEIERMTATEAVIDNPTPKDIIHSNEEGIRHIAELSSKRAKGTAECVRLALERLDNGTYGICYGCKQRHLISEEELHLAPFRTKCTKAKFAEQPRSFVSADKRTTMIGR